MKTAYIILCLLYCCISFASKTFYPYIVNYNPSELSGHNHNWSVTQDKYGIIYCVNIQGLFEFNGNRWQLHEFPHGIEARSVAYDSISNRIYTGYYEEFGYWERNSIGELHYTSLIPLLKNNKLHNEDIWSVTIARDAVFFRSFTSCYTYKNGEITKTVFPALSLSMAEVNNVLYASTLNGIYSMDENEWLPVKNSHIFSGNQRATAILPYSKDTLLVVTEVSGLYLYLDGVCLPFKTKIDEELKKAQINRAIMSRDSCIILGTLNSGIFSLDKKGSPLWCTNKLNGLQNNTVLGLFCDKDNNIWAGLEKGIDRIQSNSPLYFYLNNIEIGSTVYAICEYGGFIYLGTNRGLFYSPAGNIDFKLIEGTKGQVWYLSVYDGQLFCGHNDGSYIINKDKAQKISSVTGGLCMTDMITSRGERILLQGTYTSLVVYRKNARGKWFFYKELSGFSEPVRYIEIDPFGNIFATHLRRGLFRLNLSGDLSSVIVLNDYLKEQHEIFKDKAQVNVFKVNNRIVFATLDKFYTYDDIENQIILYKTFNSELSDFITTQRIIHAEQEQYWLVEKDKFGLFDFSGDKPRLLKIVPFSSFRNLLIRDYEYVFTGENTYFFALDNGMARLNKTGKNDLYLPSSTPISFENIISYTGNGKKRYLEISSETGKSETEIPFEYRNLLFKVVYPSYSSEDLKILYRLEGLENGWSVSDGKYLEKDYARLFPGKYVFQVRAIDENGNELTSDSYPFYILSPWYTTTWAYLVYVLLFLALIFIFYKYQLKYIEKQRRRIEMEQEKLRERQKEAQEREIMRLENEKLETELLYKSKEISSTAMSVIQKNELIAGLSKELSGLRKDEDLESIKKKLSLLIKNINKNIHEDEDWDVFKTNFDLIHDKFFRTLKERWPDLTSNDLRHCAYLRLNFSTKEIANLLNISVRGVEVSRYRLRKKLGVSPEKNLNEFMIELK